MSTLAQIFTNLANVPGWTKDSKAQLDALRFNYAQRLIGGAYVHNQ